MRIVETVRRKHKVQQRHIASLGPYDAGAFQRYRAVVADWKALERSPVVLQELAEDSGRLQGRGYLRKFRRW